MKMNPPLFPIKPLTDAEKQTWGICPICNAGHSMYCNLAAGINIQNPRDAKQLEEIAYTGYHIARYDAAPKLVQLVPWQEPIAVAPPSAELNSSNSSAENASSAGPS